MQQAVEYVGDTQSKFEEHSAPSISVLVKYCDAGTVGLVVEADVFATVLLAGALVVFEVTGVVTLVLGGVVVVLALGTVVVEVTGVVTLVLGGIVVVLALGTVVVVLAFGTVVLVVLELDAVVVLALDVVVLVALALDVVVLIVFALDVVVLVVFVPLFVTCVNTEIISK